MRVKDAVGRFGEQVAVEHLQDAGVTILDRNWRCREGELDIVARDGDTLVFVEVKTRSSSAFGLPAGAVSARKVPASAAWPRPGCRPTASSATGSRCAST